MKSLLLEGNPQKMFLWLEGAHFCSGKKNSGCGGTFIGEALLISANGKLGSCGRGYFTERNGTLENTERLCKSSLQCLISTNCTPMDRVRRVLHAGNRNMMVSVRVTANVSHMRASAHAIS